MRTQSCNSVIFWGTCLVPGIVLGPSERLAGEKMDSWFYMVEKGSKLASGSCWTVPGAGTEHCLEHGF